MPEEPPVPPPFSEAAQEKGRLQAKLDGFNQWVGQLQQEELRRRLPALRRATAAALFLNTNMMASVISTESFFMAHPEQEATLRPMIENDTGLSIAEFEKVRSVHNHLHRPEEASRDLYITWGYKFITQYVNDLVKYETLGRARFIEEEAPDSGDAHDRAKFARRLAVLDGAAKTLGKNKFAGEIEVIKKFMGEGIMTETVGFTDEEEINQNTVMFRGMQMAANDFFHIYLDLGKQSKEKLLSEPKSIEDRSAGTQD
jgi:hypothetical protein